MQTETDIRISQDQNRMLLSIKGRLDIHSMESIWDRTLEKIKACRPSELVVDAKKLTFMDGVGVVFLMECESIQTDSNCSFFIQNLAPQWKSLFSLYQKSKREKKKIPSPQNKDISHDFRSSQALSILGVYLNTLISKSVDFMKYTGEFCFALYQTVRNPKQIRWDELKVIMYDVGVGGFGIVALMGLLQGLILASQGTIVVRPYGGEALISSLVAQSLFVEFGPVVTAVIMAGRSGSSFAAEISTMKISEELDALTTMGIKPVGFLLVPRVIATVCMLPLLTFFYIFVGLIGGSVVVSGLGIPLSAYWDRVQLSIDPLTLSMGLIKPPIFAVFIAMIGCYMGFNVGHGARAVGYATTRSVVANILMIVVIDGIIGLIYVLI